MSSHVTIRFLRDAQNSKKATDDLIIVTREDNNLRVVMKDAYSQKNSNLLLTTTSLADYMDTLLKLARNDCDPYRSVQLDFPGYPSFLFSIARLQNPEVIQQVRAAARDVHESWLANLPAAADDISTSCSSTDSEEEYADMPALIPAAWAYP